jgi:DnaK suppressor protein
MTLRPQQLHELERMLTKRRETLEAEAHADAAKSRQDVFSETAGPVADSGDEAAADVIADVENAELSRDLLELREVGAALDRLRDGVYGACADCGGDIGLERLRSEPAARRCIDCQTIYEKTFSQPGKPKL